jgi:hypothetical protein
MIPSYRETMRVTISPTPLDHELATNNAKPKRNRAGM